MEVEVLNNEKIINSLMEFIRERVNSVIETLLSYNEKNKYFVKYHNYLEYEKYNELYNNVVISYESSNKFLPLINSLILNDDILREDLFYYFSSMSEIVIDAWKFLKTYMEEYLSNFEEKKVFNTDLFREYVNIIRGLFDTITGVIELKKDDLSNKISAYEYREKYMEFEVEFEKYEEEYYLNYVHIEKSPKKDELLKQICNMEFFRNDIE